jgi:hypothetical protein
MTHPAWIVGRDACRLGIAPFSGRALQTPRFKLDGE